MLNLKKKRNAIFIAIFIYILGISIIFFQTMIENNRIKKQRDGYYIIMDKNQKDVLKIDKKYFNLEKIEKIRFSKKNEQRVYTVEDKKLIEDIMDKINFGKFVYDEDISEIEQDITVTIFNSSNLLTITLSKDDKNAVLDYNDKKFLVTVDEEFYDFIYDLYDKISS